MATYAETAPTALILPLQGAPRGLHTIRQQHDPTVTAGVPLHVTALIPFRPPDQINQYALDQLARIAQQTPAILARFDRTGRFPGVLYLAPSDPSPFAALIHQIIQAFPQTPPYEGRFGTPVPHATIAAGTEQALTGAETAVQSLLPMTLCAAQLTLIQRTGTQWHLSKRFFLKPQAGLGLR